METFDAIVYPLLGFLILAYASIFAWLRWVNPASALRKFSWIRWRFRRARKMGQFSSITEFLAFTAFGSAMLFGWPSLLSPIQNLAWFGAAIVALALANRLDPESRDL